MSVARIILSRKSVRAFSDKPVTQQQVESILDVARRAPSGGNTQPWHFYVVAGDVKQRITDAVLKEFENGNAAGKPEYNMYPPESDSKEYMERKMKLGAGYLGLLGIDRTDQAGRLAVSKRNFSFFGAPVGIFVTVDRFADRNAWGHVGMMLQNINLIAKDMGLATCCQEAWNPFPQEILWCGVSLGYEDTSAKANELVTEREPLSKIANFYGF